MSHFKHTGNECPVCEDGELLQGEYERFCESCHTVVGEGMFGSNDSMDNYELMWKKREEYSGYYGDDRVKMVGGFGRTWFEDDSIKQLIETR